ncbi:head-tail connector protein [Rhizobium leguminosarum]|uniref:head-tail connector protein n=1 Tax=Rhizobium leguminosarum TaxID=384 RepID=UPI0004821E10|nr:head-tail connector protein [Rhizobium leguminosarum]
MLAPKLVTPATGVVIDLATAKQQCRVDISEDDTLIEGFVAAATKHIEKTLDMALLKQTWRDYACRFSRCIRLSKGPIIDVVNVKYFDGDNAQQTVNAADYQMLVDAEGCYVAFGSSWSVPSVYDRPDAVSIDYEVGVDTAEKVEPQLRTAILLHLAFLYENREMALETVMTPTGAYEALIWPFRRTVV